MKHRMTLVAGTATVSLLRAATAAGAITIGQRLPTPATPRGPGLGRAPLASV
jgi:hypothetical protein